MNLRSFLSEELWLFTLIAIVLAIAVPQPWLADYAIYLLLVVMFMISLSISLSEIQSVFRKDKRTLLTAVLLIYVISPVIAFLLSFTLPKDLAVGLIVYSAIPAAMSNAFYIKALRRNAPLTLVITAVTTLMAPLVAPVIVKLLTGAYLQMNPLDLFASLIKLIILPFIAAELVRRYAKRTAALLSRNSAPVNNICIFFVIFGVISDAAGGVWGFGWLAVIMASYFGICYALGHFSSRRESVVLGFSNGFRNGTLAMVVALEVFGPMAAMIGVIATLVHNIILVPIMFWGKRAKSGAH